MSVDSLEAQINSLHESMAKADPIDSLSSMRTAGAFNTVSQSPYYPDYATAAAAHYGNLAKFQLNQEAMRAKAHRWNITRDSLQLLEQAFAIDKFPSLFVRQHLASELKVSTRQVQVWFQNRRQRERNTCRENGILLDDESGECESGEGGGDGQQNLSFFLTECERTTRYAQQLTNKIDGLLGACEQQKSGPPKDDDTPRLDKDARGRDASAPPKQQPPPNQPSKPTAAAIVAKPAMIVARSNEKANGPQVAQVAQVVATPATVINVIATPTLTADKPPSPLREPAAPDTLAAPPPAPIAEAAPVAPAAPPAPTTAASAPIPTPAPTPAPAPAPTSTHTSTHTHTPVPRHTPAPTAAPALTNAQLCAPALAAEPPQAAPPQAPLPPPPAPQAALPSAPLDSPTIVPLACVSSFPSSRAAQPTPLEQPSVASADSDDGESTVRLGVRLDGEAVHDPKRSRNGKGASAPRAPGVLDMMMAMRMHAASQATNLNAIHQLVAATRQGLVTTPPAQLSPPMAPLPMPMAMPPVQQQAPMQPQLPSCFLPFLPSGCDAATFATALAIAQEACKAQKVMEHEQQQRTTEKLQQLAGRKRSRAPDAGDGDYPFSSVSSPATEETEAIDFSDELFDALCQDIPTFS